MDRDRVGEVSPRRVMSIDAGREVAAMLGGPAEVAIELFLPVGTPRRLLVCLPGGAMNRGYFDLVGPAAEAEMSFAKTMTAKGFAVALVDPLGIGGSSAPADLLQLTLDLCAMANVAAIGELLARLRGGHEGLGPWPELRSIGVGHSYGAALTIAQQAVEPIHDALALFGFGTGGTPDHLPEAARGLTAAEARRRLPELALALFGVPSLTHAPPPGERSAPLHIASDRLIASTGISAMVPDMLAPDAAAIEVPVLLALGDKDLHGTPHRNIAAYSGSRDVTLLVLPDTRHNHFIYPSRTLLFDRFESWLDAL